VNEGKSLVDALDARLRIFPGFHRTAQLFQDIA